MAVWKAIFVSEHLDTVQSTKRFTLIECLAIPAKSFPRVNHVKSAKHILDYPLGLLKTR